MKIHAVKNPEITQRELDHMALSREVAGECIVLMENDGTLPLTTPETVALFGSGARQTIRGGTGSGDVNTRTDVNIEGGLENAGFTVTTKDWLDKNDAKYIQTQKQYLEWLPICAGQQDVTEQIAMLTHPFQVISPAEITEEDLISSAADTAIYVISRTSGEGADRSCLPGDYLLYEEEKNQLEKLASAFRKLIVVLNVGGVIDMSEIKAIPGINAVLLMTQLGNVGGDALADVLTGRANPSGRLTDTWAADYADYPASATFGDNDGNVDDEYYTEGIYVGYRYFDTFGIEPLYPFGYGLSYTSFEIHPESVCADGGIVRLVVRVANTGSCSGKEVVQVYCSKPDGIMQKPSQELVAFAKTGSLMPGEEIHLPVEFDIRGLASYCEDAAAWLIEEGEYVIRVGSSSRSTLPAAILAFDKDVMTFKHKNLFGGSGALIEIRPPERTAPSDAWNGYPVPRIDVPTGSIRCVQPEYSGPRTAFATDKACVLTAEDVKAGRCTVEEMIAQMTVEELAAYCVGTLRSDGNVVGDASASIPGAAGDTSPIAKESRGIPSLSLADGPAGLRLQPVFKTDKSGNLLPGGEIQGDIRTPFDPSLTDENSDTYYQYCTAIPIGWALAHSWNMPLLEEIGSMVGTEMEQFGVDLWLAPALNIHRDPLCGRNFEYYSEDPLISGKTAAAITRGVQRHKGCGTTIKHFAVNNQEGNRYFTNAHVSERALREIYLKGFEIAVRESHPVSVMTSYNLLNGTHTANHYDLIQALLRDEWGFRGMVMSDWYTSQDLPDMTGNPDAVYPISASTGCVFAGNDLQMPGCRKNADDLVEAVRSGEEIDGYRITLADLQFCAANVIRATINYTS